MFEKLKSFLAPSSPAMRTVTVNTSADEVPVGFFNVRCLSGRESLGYRFKDGARSWNVGTTIVDSGERITLSVPRSELPTVVLNFQKPTQDGSQFFGGVTVVDTDLLEEDATVTWTGSKVSNSVEYI